MRLAWLRRVVLWGGFPYVFQAGLLVVFVALAVIGLGCVAPAGVPDKLFAKSNLVTLLIWGLWWPAMVWTAVLLGRAWCMVCPLELVSNLSERLGRRLGLSQRRLGRWLAAGWLILGLYAAIQMLVPGVHLHRSPHYTAIFLWVLLGLAALTGLLLKDRAFCRGFCPVGLLLGTYGRGGMLAVRAGGVEECAACDERHCLKKCNRAKLDGRSCPSLLNPPKLNSNRDCLVCGQCIKACRPNNMRLVLRAPFSRDDAREPVASWSVTLFVMLVSGFVLGELCTESKLAQKWFLAAPEWAAHQIGWPSAAGWLEGAWALFVVPTVVWSLLAVTAWFSGACDSLSGAWRRLALPLVVIVSGGHLAKGLAKVSSWAGFLPQAISDPSGATPAKALAAQSMSSPSPLLPMPLTACLGLAILITAVFLAIREGRLAAALTREKPTAIPMVALVALFGVSILAWGLG